MADDVRKGARGGTLGLRLDATTPNGRYWSCDDLPAGTRRLADAERLLSLGDVISVHDGRTDERLEILRVARREGDLVILERVHRED